MNYDRILAAAKAYQTGPWNLGDELLLIVPLSDSNWCQSLHQIQEHLEENGVVMQPRLLEELRRMAWFWQPADRRPKISFWIHRECTPEIMKQIEDAGLPVTKANIRRFKKRELDAEIDRRPLNPLVALDRIYRALDELERVERFMKPDQRASNLCLAACNRLARIGATLSKSAKSGIRAT